MLVNCTILTLASETGTKVHLDKETTRKRRVAQNVPHNGKRRKAPKCTTEPKNVTADQLVTEFPDEKLTVSSKKLFCSACKEEVALKKSIIE